MNIAFSRPKPIYAPMPKEQRRALVKRQGFCSTAPAERINDTIFCGNGALTALLYGDPIEERIDFHHELLYMPKWKNPPAPPKIADVLPEVRKMLREGELRKTPAYALNAILRDPVYDELMRWSPDRSTRWSIQSNRRHGSFSLNIHMDTAGEVRDYLRTADFSSGETKVYYTDDRGALCLTYRAMEAALKSLPAEPGKYIQVAMNEKMRQDRAKMDRIVKAFERLAAGT